MAPWRAVEAQHVVATRKLVDSDAEQEVLEELIESAKPVDPTEGAQHYLLATPFRYPPLPHGSRFGGAFERGIWYGSVERRTVFAEVAYYRLLFLEGTSADLGPLEVELTVFRARVATRRGVDLTGPPFDAFREQISSPSRYGHSQALGRAMREAEVEVFVYASARDRAGGHNVGIFHPGVFGRSPPRDMESWYCVADRERVEVRKRDYFRHVRHEYPRSDFLVRSELPAPAP